MEIINSWHSYPSIYAVGHRYVKDILNVPINAEEKVDGSQFSFGVFDSNESFTNNIRCKSKGCELIIDAPEKMFVKAIESVKELAPVLHKGWTYRGEFLAKPKHNALAYDRTPNKNIIIFDINNGHESYLSYADKKAEADRIGLECVPLLFSGKMETIEQFRALLDNVSILGGQKIEGVVIKPSNYDMFGQDKKCLMAKFVSEAYKEVHAGEWKKANPSSGDIISIIGQAHKTDARWHKAIQHLNEAGKLDHSPKDIGMLMKEVPADIEKECADEIKDALYKWAWPQIRRIACAGLPEWYKEQLLKDQFNVSC